MMIPLILGVLLLICAYGVTQLRERRARKMLAGLPSYSYLPFVGNLHHFFGGPEEVFRKMTEFCQKAEETDKPVLLWAGSFPVLFLCNAEDVKLVTNSFVGKPYYYYFAKQWLGDGILIAPAPIWKRNIKKIASAGSFNTTTVESYQEKFSAQAVKLTELLKAEAGRPPFDMMDILANITLETVCQTALGVCYTSDSTFMVKYYHSFNRTLSLMFSRGFNILYHSDFLYSLTPMYREFNKHVAVLHEVTDAVMSQVSEQRDNMKKPGNDTNGKPRAKYKSYLDYLLELHERDPSFTWDQIRSEVHTIILAGQETVATALYYIFLMVGCHPEVQKKLCDEQKDIFGDSKRPVTQADLDRMVYCEAVVSETLRLYPPAPSVIRYADQDLPISSCTIPKGTACCVGVWGLGRSRRLWGSDAEEYRPGRWLEPDCPGNTVAFASFSYGRRACIGKKYAMAFMKTALSQCVRDLEFKSEADKMQFKVALALRPVNHHFIEISLRK